MRTDKNYDGPTITVRQVRSAIANMRKIGDTNVLPDRPEIRGMLLRVPHLIEVTENAATTSDNGTVN